MSSQRILPVVIRWRTGGMSSSWENEQLTKVLVGQTVLRHQHNFNIDPDPEWRPVWWGRELSHIQFVAVLCSSDASMWASSQQTTTVSKY